MESVNESHSASFWKVFPYRWCAHSWAASNFFRRAEGFARETINRLPSVLTSSGVSGSILRSSRIGRSITSARLFPWRVSFLIVVDSVLTMYHHCRHSFGAAARRHIPAS